MKVLFICTGNTCRSPMASALLLKRLQEKSELLEPGKVQAFSAGLFANEGLPASPEAIEAMREEGIDIRRHRSSSARDNLIQDADLILCMTISQRNYITDRFPEKSVNTYTICEYTGDKTGEVLDPYGQNLDAYRRSLFQLKLLVDRLTDKIIESK